MSADGRGRHGNHRRGSSHPRSRGGVVKSEHGYWRVQVGKSHPLADPNGYAYLHQLVAASALLRPFAPDEVVHHRNEDKLDNRIENLEVAVRGEHATLHNAERERDENGRFTGGATPEAGGRELDGRTWDEMPARAGAAV